MSPILLSEVLLSVARRALNMWRTQISKQAGSTLNSHTISESVSTVLSLPESILFTTALRGEYRYESGMERHCLERDGKAWELTGAGESARSNEVTGLFQGSRLFSAALFFS